MLRKQTTIVAVLLVILVIALSGVYLLATSPGIASSTPAAASSYSVQAGNQTVVATFDSTMARFSSSTSTGTTSTSGPLTTTAPITTTSSTTAVSQSSTSGGGYSYPPNAQLKVLSVSAVVSQDQSGTKTVSFVLMFQNMGGSIYVVSGGGSSLNATILSGQSMIQHVSRLRCELATAMIQVSPGEDHTSFTPGCWSGFAYELTQPGTIEVQLTLSWSNGPTPGGGVDSTQIIADFILS